MTLKQIIPWRWGGLRSWEGDDRPFESFLQGMDSLHKEMDHLFEEFWKGHGRPTSMSESWEQFHVTPRLDETEDEKAFHIKVELPGMDKDDVDITLSNGETIKLPGLPIEFNGERPGLSRDLPQPGQGAREHLLELGLSAEQLDRLSEQGVLIAN